MDPDIGESKGEYDRGGAMVTSLGSSGNGAGRTPSCSQILPRAMTRRTMAVVMERSKAGFVVTRVGPP